jgi:hypothetical protein
MHISRYWLVYCLGTNCCCEWSSEQVDHSVATLGYISLHIHGGASDTNSSYFPIENTAITKDQPPTGPPPSNIV